MFQPQKAWIEDIIPKLLEFRLPDFRVLEVSLLEETKLKIGDDKTVISIDIYDSDLAPHRSLKDQIYYYRQGSQSVPAPHHYLAFLWGRTSPNMSDVVKSWCKQYLNDSIAVLEKTAKSFEENSFDIDNERFGDIPLIEETIVFFDIFRWKELNSNLTAIQFLRTFPEVHLQIKKFNKLIDKFFNHFVEFEILIECSPEFERRIRRLYSETMYREGFTDPNQFNEKVFDEILKLYAGQVFERTFLNISQFPNTFKKILVKMTAYNLLNLDSSFQFNNSQFFSFCKNNIVNHFDESKMEIETILQEIVLIENEISQQAKLLAKEIDELRYALALKHNTTFE